MRFTEAPCVNLFWVVLVLKKKKNSAWQLILLKTIRAYRSKCWAVKHWFFTCSVLPQTSPNLTINSSYQQWLLQYPVPLVPFRPQHISPRSWPSPQSGLGCRGSQCSWTAHTGWSKHHRTSGLASRSSCLYLAAESMGLTSSKRNREVQMKYLCGNFTGAWEIYDSYLQSILWKWHFIIAFKEDEKSNKK